MQNRVKPTRSLTAFAVFLCAVHTSTAIDAVRDSVSALQAQTSALNDRLQTLSERYDMISGQLTSMNATISGTTALLQAQITTVNDGLRLTNQSAVVIQQAVGTLQGQVASLNLTALTGNVGLLTASVSALGSTVASVSVTVTADTTRFNQSATFLSTRQEEALNTISVANKTTWQQLFEWSIGFAAQVNASASTEIQRLQTGMANSWFMSNLLPGQNQNSVIAGYAVQYSMGTSIGRGISMSDSSTFVLEAGSYAISAGLCANFGKDGAVQLDFVDVTNGGHQTFGGSILTAPTNGAVSGYSAQPSSFGLISSETPMSVQIQTAAVTPATNALFTLSDPSWVLLIQLSRNV